MRESLKLQPKMSPVQLTLDLWILVCNEAMLVSGLCESINNIWVDVTQLCHDKTTDIYSSLHQTIVNPGSHKRIGFPLYTTYWQGEKSVRVQ